jgi:hypothetical protein
MNDEHDIEIDDDDAVLAGALDGAVVTLAPTPVIATEEDLDALYGEDEDIEDLGDDLDLDDLAAASPADAVVPAPLAEDPRVADLAATVDTLKAAAVSQEQRRVKRKVSAATGGAGLAGVIPIVLQLAGAVNLDPELASAIVGGVAVIGAFVAGWVTPERQSAIVAEALKGH